RIFPSVSRNQPPDVSVFEILSKAYRYHLSAQQTPRSILQRLRLFLLWLNLTCLHFNFTYNFGCPILRAFAKVGNHELSPTCYKVRRSTARSPAGSRLRASAAPQPCPKGSRHPPSARPELPDGWQTRATTQLLSALPSWDEP